jgi:hypothetical protein
MVLYLLRYRLVGPVVNFNHAIILTGNQNIAVLKPKKVFFNYEDTNIHFEPYPQISLRSQNYYQCLQMAHLINQLIVLSTAFQQHLTGKMTLAHLWNCLLGILTYGEFDEHAFIHRAQRRLQIRFVT